MVFYTLIFIVFIAEIIIAQFVIIKLVKINSSVVGFNRLLFEAKPKIKEILELSTRISEQMIELANLAVEKLKDYTIDFVIKYFKGILTSMLIWEIKHKIFKR